jgi:hypothetical protein
VIIRAIKSRITGWPGHVERMGEVRSACRILIGKLKIINYWGDLVRA